MPSKYGFGNTRKKSPYKMGKAHYGKDQKNPVPMLGDLDKDGKMSGYETARQTAIEKNTKGGPKMKHGSPMDMYGKKGSMAKKYKSDAQRKAVHASKAERK